MMIMMPLDNVRCIKFLGVDSKISTMITVIVFAIIWQ